MIEIIPAIDIIDGHCVRLSQGDYAQKKVYNADPVEEARRFEDHGFSRLHVVDLDGAKGGRIINYKTLENIANRTSLIIDFGGGLKSDADLEIAFESGAAMVTGGSIAVHNPDVFGSWIRKYGSRRIILGADCRNGKISVQGWTEDSRDDVLPFIDSWRRRGITHTICTDIARDGMLTGPNVELYSAIRRQDPDVYVIASGGVSSVADIEALERERVSGVIIGKALYEGRIGLRELVRFLDEDKD
jgi:phosphoribosylformimino-5-aminoimidazole carboxamide ribotide isomerase